MRVLFCCLVGLLYLFAPRNAQSDEPPRLELKDGDRVVLVGDTLIERDQRYGYLETLLSIKNPDKNLIFRNLGWSGDTVGGISRSGFDPPEAGFEQLRQQIQAVKPTVVLVGYGMADSFASQAGLAAFETGLSKLLNLIDSTKARVALMSPVAHADLGRPLPDPTAHNRDLALYRDVIKRVAQAARGRFCRPVRPVRAETHDQAGATARNTARADGRRHTLNRRGVSESGFVHWRPAHTGLRHSVPACLSSGRAAGSFTRNMREPLMSKRPRAV